MQLRLLGCGRQRRPYLNPCRWSLLSLVLPLAGCDVNSPYAPFSIGQASCITIIDMVEGEKATWRVDMSGAPHSVVTLEQVGKETLLLTNRAKAQTQIEFSLKDDGECPHYEADAAANYIEEYLVYGYSPFDAVARAYLGKGEERSNVIAEEQLDSPPPPSDGGKANIECSATPHSATNAHSIQTCTGSHDYNGETFEWRRIEVIDERKPGLGVQEASIEYHGEVLLRIELVEWNGV